MFQALFEDSKSIACGVENSKLRVIHQSLIYDNLKQEETDMPFLEEVLEALNDKYHPTESKANQIIGWVGSKLQCTTKVENEYPLGENQEKEADSTGEVLIEIEKLEEAHIAFSKKFGEKKKSSRHKELIREMEDMKEKITDLKEQIEGDKKTLLPLWDKPNEEGNTPLHMSVAYNKPEATNLLLKYGANTNIQDSKGQTPLHVACQQHNIQQATKLIAHRAKMIPDKRNQTPAIENLVNNNQHPAQVKKLMSEVYKSTDKIKYFKKLFEEKQVLFQMVQQPEMLASILERDEVDPDVEEFINLQEKSQSFKTVIHLAVDRRCFASVSVLLKAGSYQLKLDGASLTPNLESLFNHDEATKITESIVRGLLQKTRMKILDPQECWKILSQQNEDGRTLLSRLNLGMATWSEVVRLPAKGLKFSIVNKKVPDALLAWHKVESSGRTHIYYGTKEEAAASVRNLLERKGVIVRGRTDETELMSAILSWNEKNKHLCEYET